AHVLRCCTAHDGTEPRLELPGALSGSDHERAAPEPRHAGLEGGERAQRRIEEKEPQYPAGERMRLGTRLEAARQLEQRQHFLALEVGEIEEALHASSHRLTSTPTPSSGTTLRPGTGMCPAAAGGGASGKKPRSAASALPEARCRAGARIQRFMRGSRAHRAACRRAPP